jgi:hypothetical protein
MTAAEAATSRAQQEEAYWDVQTVVSAHIHESAVARLEVWKTVTY